MISTPGQRLDDVVPVQIDRHAPQLRRRLDLAPQLGDVAGDGRQPPVVGLQQQLDDAVALRIYVIIPGAPLAQEQAEHVFIGS